MNNLLINEYPLVVLPYLAKEIGLNEAIMLQQIHFWLNKKKHYKDKRYWVYNTYDEWVKQFPFWSKSTIRRTITSLENKKLIETGNYNKLSIDNTKWYTINYKVVESMSRPCVQNEQTDCSKWTGGSVQNEQAITIDYPKTNTETNYSSKIKDLLSLFSTINNFSQLNKKYWDAVRETRKTGRIAESVIFNNMNKWKKYDSVIVEYSLKEHIENHKGKREEYTLGIMRNTSKEEAISRMNRPVKQKGELDINDFNLDD